MKQSTKVIRDFLKKRNSRVSTGNVLKPKSQKQNENDNDKKK